MGFFTAEPLMMGQTGFSQFGPFHIAWIAVCIALIVALSIRYKRLPAGLASGSPRRRMQLVVAAIPLLLLASTDAQIIASGTMAPNWLPFHICNACMLFMLVQAIRPSRYFASSLYVFCLIGGSLAICFPACLYCRPFTWVVVCAFVEHALMIAFVVMQLYSGELRQRRRDVWMPISFMLIYGVFALAVNALFGTNFAFLNGPSVVVPLQVLESIFGNPGYDLPFVLIISAICCAMYLPWRDKKEVDM